MLDLNRLDSLSRQFHERGVVVLAPDDIPLSQPQWKALEVLLDQVDYQKVVGGDTGDPHSVWVGRFINDVEKPISLSALTPSLLDIIMSNEMTALFTRLLGVGPLCVRRCQANRLYHGDFIGYHIDRDTTPDYYATAVFQISEGFEGGEFWLHHQRHGDVEFTLPRYSVLLNRGDIPHQVKPVRSGVRNTLACFFSTNFGPTAKPRSHIQLACEELY